MTTYTVFGVAGPFSDTAGERLEPGTEYTLVDKTKQTALTLPAGSIVTELFVRRRGAENETTYDLTAGRGIAVGVNGDPRVFTGTPGVSTDELNTYDVNPDNTLYPYVYVAMLNPTQDLFHQTRSYTKNKTFVLQSAFGGNVVNGGVSVVIKYKSFSESVADKFGTA